ncbi:MAG: DUF1844 domain-containing protein [Deltaproteobacteria bacterium]|nr:DUF1844 domain-containing protein [Deltaproteobacteria bacterium]
MEEEEKEKEKGFVIKDRRHFDESGSARTEEEAKPERQPPPSTEAEPSAGEELPPGLQEEPNAPPRQNAPLPEMTFANFIFSLSTTAMYHFGDIPDPGTQETHKNLPAAKQTIDILTILRAKTEGNLDANEKELLDGVLFELRMRFVKEMKKK